MGPGAWNLVFYEGPGAPYPIGMRLNKIEAAGGRGRGGGKAESCPETSQP